MIMYILCASTFIERTWIGYKFYHALIDYKYGILRRGFEGQVLRFIFPSHVSTFWYIKFSTVLVYVSLILLLVHFCIIYFRKFELSLLLLMVYFITSPATFKNYFHELGRQDIFGFIFLLLIALLVCLKLNSIAKTSLILAVPLFCLTAENHLFLFIPLSIYISCVNWNTKLTYFNINNTSFSQAWLIYLLLFVYLISFTFPFILPLPTVPIEQLKSYIITRASDPQILGWKTSDTPLPYLYHDTFYTISRVLHFLRYEVDWISVLPGWLMPILLTLILNCLVAKIIPDRIVKYNYILGSILVSLALLPLFITGLDYGRWLSAYFVNITFLSLYVLGNCDYTIDSKYYNYLNYYLISVSVAQLFINEPLGTIYSKVEIFKTVHTILINAFSSLYQIGKITN